MESLGKLQLNQQPIHHLSLTHFSSSFPQNPPSLSFRSLRRSTPSMKCASSSWKPQDSRVPVLQSLPSRLLKSTCITFTAAAALFFANRHLKPLPAIAAPSVEPRKQSDEHYSIEDIERSIEEYLASHPDDVFVQRGLVEVRIKSRKPIEAIEAIDRLMELAPEEKEWPILRAIVIFSYSGDLESAKSGFEQIIAKDPLRVEAYHGLSKRTQEAMDKCKKDRFRMDRKDSKLLMAQILVFERNHNEALKLYQELVKEEPRDIRPYICQGVIYTFLKKQHEAEEQFDKFRKLVPRNHPYREYFTVATKLFADKAQRPET